MLAHAGNKASKLVSVGEENLPSQNASLGYVEYFRLILFKKQRLGKIVSFYLPLKCLKEFR